MPDQETLAREMYDAARGRLSEGLPWPPVLAFDDLDDEWRAAWTAAVNAGLKIVLAEAARYKAERDEARADLAALSEKADFHEADRDREELAAEHHRTAYAELEAEAADRLEGLLADAREQVASEIEGEASGHLYSIRRAMRWAAWVARGKPADSDPRKDVELSRALLHGDAERTSAACCPVETAAVARAVEAERLRIRAAATDLTFKIVHPGRGSQALDVVPLGELLGLLGSGADRYGSDGTEERP